MLEGNYRLAAAIFIGIFCGFLLVKSDLSWRKTCLNMFLLKDGRLLKTLLFSLGFGVALVYFLQNMEVITTHVRPGYFWASLIGGAISGIGLAFCFRVPITAIAALGAGRLYALWSIIGMFLAISFVDVISSMLSSSIYSWSRPIDAPQQADTFLSADNPALWVVLLSLISLVFLHFAFNDGAEE